MRLRFAQHLRQHVLDVLPRRPLPRQRKRAAEAARQRLGDAFGVEWKAGSELTLNEAVALALGEE
jgi:hypothetical protein